VTPNARRGAATRREREEQHIEELLAAAGHRARSLPPPNRSCDGKQQYGRRLAERVAAEMRARHGADVRAYACVYCPAWHVGHALGSEPPRLP
jgi:hypothetical protein